MTKFIEPIIFWFISIVADELATGVKFFLLFNINGLKSTTALPIRFLLLPYEAQIYIENVPLFKYLKKN